ncbi:hypothetical protein HDU98_009762 [Podochytrium sp. JEL0797]|nr:hypothetical protein HDU98_009762 [Podochytrium sp. JEL0797]
MTSSPLMQSPPLPPLPTTATTPSFTDTATTSKSLLRSQVASTLHKTLQLEHKLTLKELESYEKQLATADLACHRALAALHAAQVVQLERRRELDVAIMERSGGMAVAKHLRARLEGLRKRMWDGEDAKRRGSSASAMVVGGFGSVGGGGASLELGMEEEDMDLFGGPASGIQALMNPRRHSSPAYAFSGSGFTSATGSPGFGIGGGGGSANSSLDDENAGMEQDEIAGFADAIHDASAGALREDYDFLGLGGCGGLMDSMHDEKELDRRGDGVAGLSNMVIKSNLHAALQQQQHQHEVAGYSFPVVTMTRLNSSGPVSTSNKNATDLSMLRRSSLGINGNAQLLNCNPMSPKSPSLDSLTLGSSVACVSYQRGQCLGIGNEGCASQHHCVRCLGGHPVILCKKDRNVCVKWNMEECNAGCYREHRCLRCASRNHTLRVCPIRPLGGSEFCFAWNSAGTCRIMDCRRLHGCIRCGASHPSIICPENLDNYLSEYIAKRRAEGLADDDLLRLELQLSHSLPSTSTAVATTTTDVATATPISSNTGMLPPLPYNSGYGVFPHQVGPPPQMGGMQQQAMGMRGGDHPMHVAASQLALRVLSGSGASSPYHQSMMMMGQQQQNAYGFGGGSYPHTFGGYEVGGLSENERIGVCRDWNNLKCESEDNRCRFRHVCLRCGGVSHRERQCPLLG